MIFYLNQRLYLPAQKTSPTVVCILSRIEEIELQRSNLLDLLKMIVLQDDCWHKCIESYIGNPFELPAIDLTNCGDACPFCLGIIKEFIMPVSHEGLSQFLADVFINNPGEDLTPLLLVKKLSKFKVFGIVVYGRPRSKKYHHASIYRLPFYS